MDELTSTAGLVALGAAAVALVALLVAVIALVRLRRVRADQLVVLVTISGSGDPIRVRRTVDQTKAGTEATASIALGRPPPVGDAVTITVQVQRVPGEANVDNNRQQYTALFTR